MPFTQTGTGAIAQGWADISSIGRDLQESAVRPRELEAATSLKETQAAAQRLQLQQLQRIAGLEQESAAAMRDAGTQGDLVKQQEDLMKRALQHGMVGYANDIKKTLEEQKLSSYKSLEEAAKVQASKNESEGGYLRGLSSFEEAGTHADAKLQEAEDKLRSNPTQENAQELMRARAIKKQVEDARASGDWNKFKTSVIDPYADTLDKRSLQLRNEQIQANAYWKEQENARKERELAEKIRKNDMDNAAKREKTAVDRERAASTRTKEVKGMAEAEAKENRAYIAQKSKIQSDLAKMEKQVTDPDSPWYRRGLRENPDYVEKKATLKELETKHEESMAKFRAVDTTPEPKKPVDKTTKVEYTQAQEDWITRALQHNPGMSREDVIAQGKKLKKL